MQLLHSQRDALVVSHLAETCKPIPQLSDPSTVLAYWSSRNFDGLVDSFLAEMCRNKRQLPNHSR